MNSNKIIKIIKNITNSIPKIIWAISCYIIALALAFISGYFTVKFYTDGNNENDKLIMGLMAICLEIIKLMLAAGYPFMKYRNKKIETHVSLVMKISFFLSVLASMYYLLLESNISKSPASKTISMLYKYIEICNIIPLEISQFLATISLTVLIEFFIIWLPILAPIMFIPKKIDDQISPITNFQKLKVILSVLPEKLIDKVYSKVLLENKNNQLNIFESQKQLSSNNESKLYKSLHENHTTKQLYNPDISTDSQTDIIETPLQEKELNFKNKFSNKLNNDDLDSTKNFDSTSEKELLEAIYTLKEDEICPSVKKLEKHTGAKRNEIYSLKKKLEEADVLKTEGTKTIILCDLDIAIQKLGII
jgi:hypothetical protein